MADRSADDKTKLLKIFPNEVWEMILGEVKDAPNYHRISNASWHFRSLLLPRAPQLLFPDVANCLVERYADVESLSLRQVCRDWRKGVDQRLQTQDLYQDKHQLIGFCNYATVAVFGKNEDFANFEQHFDPTHHLASQVNPFLSRGVQITVENDDAPDLADLEPLYTACNRMLEKYGCHVWHFTIDFRNITYPERLVDMYKRRLPAILQLTPNLRVLVILCQYSYELEEYRWENVEQMPFPNLHQLGGLYLSEMPAPVARELVLKTPQVHLVEAGCTVELMPIYVELLPKLKEIRFTCAHPIFFEAFRNTRITDQVEAFWLDTFGGEVPWEVIFPALESKFSETLSELRLRLPSFYEEDLDEAPKLVLSNLKRLTLAMSHDGWPLDFLQPMKNTREYLCVQLWLEDGTNTSEVIQEAGELEEEDGVKLFECWKELEMSSVWSIFPKLKILKTVVYTIGANNTEVLEECHSCTRDDWKKARSGKL